MRFNHLKATLKSAVLTVTVLLLGGGVAVAQQQVNLTAAPTSTTLPDGTVVPMWGYSCAGPTVIASSTATCALLNPAAGAKTALTWLALRPGTYLIESGTHPSIQGPMGLYGMLVVTTAPAAGVAGTAYPAVGTTPAVTYNADVPLLLSEIDSVQNTAVAKAVTLTGFSETTVWSGLPGCCGNPATANSGNCYPPAVNYTPLYYLFNGVAFNKTAAATANPSLFPATAGTTTSTTGVVTPVTTGITGNVLVRFVNAGSRMHVPSIVGSQIGAAVAPATVPPSGFSLIAEDGNLLPGVPRVQSEVFMAAGKTYDVMINVPAAGGTALPVFDRQLSLSSNATARDSGMLAYIGVNGAGVPAAPAFATAVARADTYNSRIAGHTFTVSDPGKGVVSNDTNVYGVTLLAPPTGGAVTLNRDGTFTYTAGTGTAADSFTYCANGSVTGTACSSGITTTVTLGPAPIETAGITMGNITYNSNVATSLSIMSPASCRLTQMRWAILL